MSKKGFHLIGLVLVVGLLFAALPAGRVSAADLCVNQDGSGGCLATIQAAINAAATGDTINVAAGSYAGFSVSGKTNLTIQGTGTGQTLIEPTTLIATGVGHKYTANMLASVFVNNSTGITLSGMTIKSTSATPGSGGADAIVFWNASTGTISNSAVQGIYTINGVQTGQGIAVDGGTTTLALTNTSVSGFQKNAIDAVDGNGVTTPGDITITISGGSFSGAGPTSAIAQNGIMFWNRGGGTVDGSISGATISGFQYTGTSASASGLLLYGLGTGASVSVSGNTFSNNDVHFDDETGTYNPATILAANTFSRAVINGHLIYDSIQAAIDDAAASDSITIYGTHELTTVVNVDKAVTLACSPTAVIKVSGTGDRFDISQAATLQGCTILKTDKTGEQNIIRIRASGIKILNNTITGQYVYNDPDVSRAMVINAGEFTNLEISGNTISHLRQPAYISGTHTGTISNNNVTYTKGWVVEGGNLTFTGNTFNNNVGDIAILTTVPSAYYTDIVALSNANNQAVVEDQRLSPALLSVVYVDDSAAAGGNGTQAAPLQSITAGIERVMAGGTVKVAEGNYVGAITISKSLTLKATGLATNTIINGGATSSNPAAGLYTVSIRASNVVFDGFTVTNPGFNSTWPSDPTGIMVGYYGDNSLSNIRVTNNIVTQVTSPTFIVNYNAPHGIVVNGVVTGLEIDHNTIHDIAAVVNTSGYGGSTGIALYGYDTTPLSTNVNIHDNVVYDIRVTNTGTGDAVPRGIRVGWGAGAATIAANQIHDLAGVGIQTSASANAAVSITGNTIQNVVTGVSMGHAAGGSITGNTISASGTGILLGSAVGSAPTITSNHVLSPAVQFRDDAQKVTMSTVFASNTWAPYSIVMGWDILVPGPVHNVTQNSYFNTVQAAIDAAAAGDVIEIREGTYVENVNVNKGVTLRGDGSRFTNPLQTGESPAEGVWYPDRYRPAVFEIATFGGETVIKHGVRSTDSETSRPSPYNSSFYNTQGRKYDVNLAGPTQTVTIDMFVGADWASDQRNPGLWATGFDGADISAYPILAWRSTTGVVPGFYAFDYINGGWLELRKATPADYNVWHTLKIVLNVGTGVDYYVDGQKLRSFADPDTKTIGNLILNVYNFGSDYDVYWKNLLAQAAPTTVTGLMTISASNVTVEGLTLTNPGGSYGVYVNPGIAHINILNNVITDIGGSTTTANVKGIYLLNGPDDIRIEGNTFQNLQASGKSVNGVYAGDSNATDPVVGITIRANLFTAISSDTKGGYGILFNNLAGTQNVLITLNTFDQISGGWTHAIGLEGPTPGALVTGNTFKNLNALSPDLTAVFFEDNPVGGTAKLENNMFMNAGFGAAIHPKHAPYTYVVDASPNYWGSSCGPVAAHAMAGENVEFYPWYTDDGMTSQSAPASYTITSGMTAGEINAVLTCAAPGSTITFGIGNHPGNLVIPAGREHLTLVLQNGAVINASSPCFNVQADFTTIKAQNIGMASCVTVAGSNGIDVAAGLRNLTVDGLEITGAGNDGIHFAGAITDVVLKDNFIHDLVGNGVYFGGQPIALTTGGIDIHGNLFQNNTGKGIEAGTFTVPAEYNSWGSESGAAAGDGISSNVDADPFTHVDVYMTASGTPWTGIPLNQVQIGQTITFTVKAHVVNALTVDVKLAYPTNLTNPVANLADSAFPTLAEFDTDAPANTIWFHGMAPYVSGSGYLPITGDMELFKVTFTGSSAGLTLPMNLDETSDMFGMAAAGSSANIYAAALTDSTVNVIALPTIDIVPLLVGPYTAGLPIEFNLTVSNTGGGNFSDLHLDWTIPTGAVLQYWDGDSWEAVSDPLDIGTLAADATAFDAALPKFRITFMDPPSGTLSVSLFDLQPATDFQLAVTSETFPLAGNFTVTGTFSMQGRSTRAGIPVALDYQGLVAYSDLSGTTIDQISLNLVIANVNGGSWLLTTNQPRYLNVDAALGKVVSVAGNETLIPLQLKGGNAVWTDNIINVNDASKVGNTFGSTTVLDGDCNFDGIVNVQDLAMVGGNYDLTSLAAYGSWGVQ